MRYTRYQWCAPQHAIVDCCVHVVLEFESNVYVGNLSIFLRSFYAMRVDCQQCRSHKSALKYCSKKDLKLYTNCKISDLHINYRLHKWDLHMYCAYVLHMGLQCDLHMYVGQTGRGLLKRFNEHKQPTICRNYDTCLLYTSRCV